MAQLLVHDRPETVQHRGSPNGVEMALRRGGEPQAQGDAVGECRTGVLGAQVVDLVGDQQVVDVAGRDPRAQAGLEGVALEGGIGGDDGLDLVEPGGEALVALFQLRLPAVAALEAGDGVEAEGGDFSDPLAAEVAFPRRTVGTRQTTMSMSGRLRSATLLASTSAVTVLPEPVAMAKTPRPPALLQARMASFW